MYAKESAMLSLIGKVVYDSGSDTIRLEHNILITSLGYFETIAKLKETSK